MADVTILLATCCGRKFLSAQLKSYTRQDCNWSLWVSDDGSDDGTLEILRDFAAAHPQRDIRILQGPRQGSAANFLSLLLHPDLPPRPVALSDQDDIWLDHHISVGLASITGPMLYGCSTFEFDDDPSKHRISRTRPPPTSFPRALVQNVIAGNTMILSAEALALVRAFPPKVPVPHHDWWIYLLLTAFDVPITINARAGILYRQHACNHIGSSRSLSAKIRRAQAAFGGTYGQWIARNCEALDHARNQISPANRAILDVVRAELGHGGIGRAWRLRSTGVRRETTLGTAAMLLSAATGRI